MRKILTFLFAALMSVGTIFAERVQIGNLYYNLDAGNNTAEVTYEVNNSPTNYSGLTSVDIPSSVTYENQTYTVTSIGVDAFWGCSGLTNITIPSSVTSIEDGAFTGCTGLTSIEIPSSVTSIGLDAFYSCTNISDVYCYPNAADLTWDEDGCDDFKSGKATNCHVNSDQLDAYQTKFNDVVRVTFVGNLDAPAPAAPAWLLPGDEWDDATKTLTVNSNPIDYAYSGGVSDIENLVISDAVTSIGASAFAECTGLTSITIPNNVTSIGVGAFAACSGLTSMVVASGNTKYDSRGNCNAIIETSTNTLIAGCQNTIIPNSVTSIGEGAFFVCTGLTSVTIPNSVNSIGPMAFAMCGLTSIEIPNSVTSIGEGAFAECSGLETVTILAESLESYGTDAFEGTAAALTIYVPAGSVNTYKAGWAAYEDKIVAIPAPTPSWVLPGDEWDDATKTLTVNSDLPVNAYMGQDVIEHVIISSGVTSIGEAAFYGCSSLTSVTIGNSVTSIGNYAFTDCSGLTSVTIGNSVTSIVFEAFFGCASLTSIVVASGNTTYDSRDNCNAIIETATNTLIVGCQNTIIPNSVTSIGTGAFYGCTGLTSIEIPNSVTSIGMGAFSGCGFTSITIPNSVTSIGEAAFYYCTGLTSVTIGNSVTSIGADAFIYCTNITDVYCYADPNNLTWNDDYCNDFKYADHATVCHVKACALATYEANWGGTTFDDDNTGVNVTFVGDLTGSCAVVIGDPNNASQIETFLTNNNGQTIDELIIDRPVLNNMYNTLCLPFDMDADQIAASSLNGVEIREFTGASVDGTTLNLSVGDPVNAVVAGRPYFVKYSAASQLDDLHFEGVTINNAVLNDKAITFDGVTFKGTFTPFVMPNGLSFQGGYLFLGQNNQLYWPNTNNPLKPFRAYFYVDVESSTQSNAPKYRGMPARIVEGKNVATGVENAQSANQSTKVIVNGQLIIIKNDVRYNAQGQIVK